MNLFNLWWCRKIQPMLERSDERRGNFTNSLRAFDPLETGTPTDAEVINAAVGCITTVIAGAGSFILGLEISGRLAGRPGLGVELLERIFKNFQGPKKK